MSGRLALAWVEGGEEVRARMSVRRLEDLYASGEVRACMSCREKAEG